MVGPKGSPRPPSPIIGCRPRKLRVISAPPLPVPLLATSKDGGSERSPDHPPQLSAACPRKLLPIPILPTPRRLLIRHLRRVDIDRLRRRRRPRRARPLAQLERIEHRPQRRRQRHHLLVQLRLRNVDL